MRNVLILCDLFPPAFGPRMGYLCKYIKALGWNPVVLTEAINENMFTFLTKECTAQYISYYPTTRNKYLKKIQWVIIQLLDICFHYKDRRMVQEAQKLLSKQSFDLILCSTYRTFPLTAAQKIAQKYQLPWVADLRDIIEQYTGDEFISHKIPHLFGLGNFISKFFKQQNLYTRNQALLSANAITTVSPWHVKTLYKYNTNTHLIYNGFDPDIFYPEQIKTDQFIITYTGRILSTAMRDPSLLLQGLAELYSNKQITPEQCRVHWYVDEASWQIIKAESQKEGVEVFMDYKGYVAADKIPSVLNQSSILLLLTNKSSEQGPKGVMTTKFFESLAVRKPILCVRSDEGVLETALLESQAGIAARQKKEVCSFLLKYMNEWKEKGFTTSSIRSEVLQNYSRKEQAKQFVRIFENIIQ